MLKYKTLFFKNQISYKKLKIQAYKTLQIKVAYIKNREQIMQLKTDIIKLLLKQNIL